MNNNELKKCPFCGGDAEIVPPRGASEAFAAVPYWFIHCRECFARGAASASKNSAIIFWNSRK